MLLVISPYFSLFLVTRFSNNDITPTWIVKKLSKKIKSLYCSFLNSNRSFTLVVLRKTVDLFSKLIFNPCNLKKETINETYTTHFEMEFTFLLDIFKVWHNLPKTRHNLWRFLFFSHNEQVFYFEIQNSQRLLFKFNFYLDSAIQVFVSCMKKELFLMQSHFRWLFTAISFSLYLSL